MSTEENVVLQDNIEETAAPAEASVEDVMYKAEDSTAEVVDDKGDAEAVKEEIKEEAEEIAVESKEDDTPEDYSLELSEGSLLTKDQLESVQSFAKENGLSEEQAGKLLSQQEESVNSFKTSQESEFKSKVESWKADSLADKDFGGDKFTENVAIASKGMKTFFGDDFVDFLNESGFGNHPMVLKGFLKIGKAMSDDTVVKGGSTVNDERSAADVLYGN